MPEDSFLTVEYRLPVTAVRFKGVVTTTVDSFEDPPKTSTVADATAAFDTRADTRTRCTLAIRDRDLVKLDMSLKLLGDGRLASSSAEIEDQSASQLVAALSVGASTTSGLLPLLGGAGAPGVAASVVAGLVAGGATYFRRAHLQLDSTAPGPADEDQVEKLSKACAPENPAASPTPADVGLDERFRSAQPASFEVLFRYRVALLYLAHAHAATARDAHSDPQNAAKSLRSLDRLLASTRAEAARVEEIYRVWREGFIRHQSEQIDEQLFIDQLPTTSDFLALLHNPPPTDDDAPKWWPISRQLRLMMTCDLLDEHRGETYQGPWDNSDGTIVHRVPLHAKVTTWRLRRGESRGWFASEDRVDWVLATHPAATRATRLPMQRDTDSKVSIEFDASGALTSVEANTTGKLAERNEALAKLPDVLSTTASAVGTALSPATRAADLKARVEEQEQRAKLQGLLNPSPDSLAELRKELTRAELEARVALANHMKTDPTSVFVVAQTADAD